MATKKSCEEFHLWRRLGNAVILFALAVGGIQLLSVGEATDFGRRVFDAVASWRYLLALIPAIGVLVADNPINIPLVKMGEYATVVGASFYLSTKMAKLSGTALWIPYELRTMVAVLVSLIGEAAFNRVSNKKRIKVEKRLERERAAHDKNQATKIDDDELRGKAEREVNKKYYPIGFSCFIAAALLFFVFMLLRARCVKGFDVRDWLAYQKRDNLRAATTNPTSNPTTNLSLPDEVVVFDGSMTKPIKLANYEYHVPEFVDIQRQQVYLPLWFPDALQKSIDDVGKMNDADGLTYELAYEPNDLFEMVEKQAYWQVAVSNWAFLLLDAAITAFAAAGMACFFEFAALLGSMVGEMAGAESGRIL